MYLSRRLRGNRGVPTEFLPELIRQARQGAQLGSLSGRGTILRPLDEAFEVGQLISGVGELAVVSQRHSGISTTPLGAP